MREPAAGRLSYCLALAAMATACGGTDRDEIPEGGSAWEGTHSSQHAIVNGKIHLGHPAVGSLSHSLGSSCSATLVGARTVLTAAHCVWPGATHRFRLGGRRWPVESVIPHPDYAVGVIVNDVAVVRLSEKPPIQPAAVAVEPPSIGQLITLVGLGQVAQDDDTLPQKRIAQNTVSEMDDQRLTYRDSGNNQGNVCFGDSGGPSFAQVNGREVVVGVHSYIRGECGLEGNDMRVDIHRQWLQIVSDGDLLQGGFSDDMPPEVEITAPMLGEIVYPQVTIKASIRDLGGLRKVELHVDGTLIGRLNGPSYEAKIQLSPGLHTINIRAIDYQGNQSSQEVHTTVLEFFPFGTACEQHGQCESGLCARGYGRDINRCTERCDPTIMESCPTGTSCQADDGAAHICLAPKTRAELPWGCALAPNRDGQAPPPLTSLWVLGLLMVIARSRRTSRTQRNEQ